MNSILDYAYFLADDRKHALFNRINCLECKVTFKFSHLHNAKAVSGHSTFKKKNAIHRNA